jgi:hypothetical protein
MTDRKQSLESIAETVSDYREGDVARITPKKVDRWVSQFPDDIQDEILCELDYVLTRTYISRETAIAFLRNLATHEKFSGGKPKAFWKRANLLDIQLGGNSQRELLAMFGKILEQEHGLTLADCGSNDGPFVYLDDGLFGGGRVLQDLAAWIKKDAPDGCEIHVVVFALHSGGQYYVNQKLAELKSLKKFKITWWRILEIENRRYQKNSSDVLWPTKCPTGALADTYIQYITQQEPKYKIELRSPGSIGGKKSFSSDKGRTLLEQTFLDEGLRIRSTCRNLPESMRPLGASLLKTFGFGSTIVTFRNCPNNCPLAFWVGAPWYPLFPRSTNTDAFMKQLLDSFRPRGSGIG